MYSRICTPQIPWQSPLIPTVLRTHSTDARGDSGGILGFLLGGYSGGTHGGLTLFGLTDVHGHNIHIYIYTQIHTPSYTQGVCRFLHKERADGLQAAQRIERCRVRVPHVYTAMSLIKRLKMENKPDAENG